MATLRSARGARLEEWVGHCKAELIAESGWKREFKTDEQGAFEATLPWRGA